MVIYNFMKTFKEWVEAKAKLGDVTDHPLYGQQHAPVASPMPQQKKLDNSAGLPSIVNQYISAFGQKLDSGITDEEAHQIIDVNAKKLGFRFGKSVEDFFRSKALFKLQNVRSYQSAVNKS